MKTLSQKIEVITSIGTMVPVGIMIKDRINSLYEADATAVTLRDKLLAKGLIKKVAQEVTEVAPEEVVEEAPEAKMDIHEVNIKLLELEGIERAFKNVEYLHKLFDKRLKTGDFRVSGAEEKLAEISEAKIKDFNLNEVKGEIKALKKIKKALMEERENKAISEAITKIIENEVAQIVAEEEVKAKKVLQAEEKLFNKIITSFIEEHVAKAAETNVEYIHKVLVKTKRQENAAKARAVLAAKRAQAKAKAQATNVFGLLGLNIEVLTDVTELMHRTNASMKEAWTWFHKYSAAPAVTYGRRF